MKDEEEEELAALRQSSRYAQVQAKFGTRHVAKRVEKPDAPEDMSSSSSSSSSSTKKEPSPTAGFISLRDMLPMSFGSQKSKEHAPKRQAAVIASREDDDEAEEEEEEDKEIPQKWTSKIKQDTKEQSDSQSQSKRSNTDTASASPDGSGDDSAEDEDLFQLPITHEALLCGHTRAISAVALDPTGTRLLTGSYDYKVKMWDFAGMNEKLQSFREIEPYEGHQVCHLEFNQSGEHFLAVTGNSRAKIYTRDGFEVCETLRGDMYIQDLKNTKGHITGLTNGHWHPHDKSTFITSSLDGTIRVWDVKDTTKNKLVMKFKRPNQKISVTACAYSSDGAKVAGAANDGSIQLWNPKGSGISPESIVRNAHTQGTDTSCVCFSSDNKMLLSRGGDSTLKVWDIRKFKQPLKVFDELENDYMHTDVIFNPSGDIFATGTSNKSKEGKGLLVFFDQVKLEKISSIVVADESVIRVQWNGHINQIVLGCSDAKAHVLYDPELSKNGALLCVGRKARVRDVADSIEYHDIVNPHSLPLYAKERSRKRQKIKEREDSAKTKRPELPVSGPGRSGRIGRSYAQYMVSQFAKPVLDRDIDPRDVLLSFDKRAKENPVFFGDAYKKTQPVPLFEANPAPEEGDKQANIRKA